MICIHPLHLNLDWLPVLYARLERGEMDMIWWDHFPPLSYVDYCDLISEE